MLIKFSVFLSFCTSFNTKTRIVSKRCGPCSHKPFSFLLYIHHVTEKVSWLKKEHILELHHLLINWNRLSKWSVLRILGQIGFRVSLLSVSLSLVSLCVSHCRSSFVLSSLLAHALAFAVASLTSTLAFELSLCDGSRSSWTRLTTNWIEN